MNQHLKKQALKLADNTYVSFHGKGYLEFKGEKSDGTVLVAVFDVSEYTPSEAQEAFKLKLEQ